MAFYHLPRLQEEQLQQRLEQFEQQRTAAVNAATTNAAAVGRSFLRFLSW